jgi:hypothetical protein
MDTSLTVSPQLMTVGGRNLAIAMVPPRSPNPNQAKAATEMLQLQAVGGHTKGTCPEPDYSESEKKKKRKHLKFMNDCLASIL